MKRILLICLLAMSSTAFAQYGTAYNRISNMSWSFIVTNTGLPNSQAPCIWTAFDSCRDFHWYTRTMFLDSFRTRNDSVPTATDKLMYLRQSDGQIMAANAENWYTAIQVDSAIASAASAPAPTISTASRSLNSNFTISATKNAFVTYTVTCSATNPLLVGSSTASVFLEYSTNSGSSWVTVSQQSATSSVALAVTVALTQSQTNIVSGYIPANALVRLRSTTSGTASVTYITGQEVTF